MLATDPAKLIRLFICWICFFGLSEVALAADTLVQDIEPMTSASSVRTSSIKQISAAPKIFSPPVFLRGMLGKLQVQMYLHPHVEYEDSVQGDYFVYGKSVKIMLAGEFQDDDLAMEESENGSDVSGQWSGKLDGAVFRGTWYSDEQSHSEPFELTVFEPKNAPPSFARSMKGNVKTTSANTRHKAHRD